MADLDLAIAQLLIAGIPGDAVTKDWLEGLERFPFGGVHIAPWNAAGPEQVAALIAEASAAISRRGVAGKPLVTADHEGGSFSPFQQGEACDLPGNMALGATGDPESARRVGAIMGRELAALGVNLNWAPVVDVNLNPRNPVIGVRAFGDHPRIVTEFGIAMMQGMKEGGIACAMKHFPGHGDTVVDSHFGLPVIDDEIGRLEAWHLPPFAAGVAAGADAVMTAHILFPALAGSLLDPTGQSARVPATLNPVLLDRLLRHHLGFDGVIVTDALEMWGIRGQYDSGEAALLSFEAGADMPLVAFDEEARRGAFTLLRDAVKIGRISEARLEQSLRRIMALRHKVAGRRAAAGLLGGFDPAAHEARLERHRGEIEEIAQRAVVLAADPAGILPLRQGDRVALLLPYQERMTLADTTGGKEIPLAHALRAEGYQVAEYRYSEDPSGDEQAAAMAWLEQVGEGPVVVGLLNAWRFEGQQSLLRSLGEVRRSALVVVALRDPHDLSLVPVGAAALATCSTQPAMIRALARVLSGLIPGVGRLPVVAGS